MTHFEIASKRNNEVANLSDNQIYVSRDGRELRGIAREAVANPIICTAREFGERYGRYFAADVNWASVADHDADEVWLWALAADVKRGRKNIYATAICPAAEAGEEIVKEE